MNDQDDALKAMQVLLCYGLLANWTGSGQMGWVDSLRDPDAALQLDATMLGTGRRDLPPIHTGGPGTKDKKYLRGVGGLVGEVITEQAIGYALSNSSDGVADPSDQQVIAGKPYCVLCAGTAVIIIADR